MIAACRIGAFALLASFSGCASDANDINEHAPPAEPTIRIAGELAFRDSLRPETGSVALLTVSVFSPGDEEVEIVSKAVELDFPGAVFPFELTVPQSQLQSGPAYVLRASVRDSSGRTGWVTQVGQIIDPTATDTDTGLLMLVRTRDNDGSPQLD